MEDKGTKKRKTKEMKKSERGGMKSEWLQERTTGKWHEIVNKRRKEKENKNHRRESGKQMKSENCRKN